MLHVYFGDLENEIYNPEAYFINQYEDEWITSNISRDMIRDIDDSIVIDSRVIDSPVLGPITPRELSGSVKTLILMAFEDSDKIFNGSACGNNCAKWILKIAENKELTITLHNIMDFGIGKFENGIEILNSGKIVHNSREYVEEAVRAL